VEKSNGKLYWYSTGGQVLEETDLSGNLINDYIYFGGGRLARQDASGNAYYYFADPLGTVKGIVSGTTLCYDADFYPFGGEKVFTNTCAQNYKFTGLERDAESGLDETLYRMYSSNLGRWLEADPVRVDIGAPAGLDLTPFRMFSSTQGRWSSPNPASCCGCGHNPQDLDRYAYVRNDPANKTDPRGDTLANCMAICETICNVLLDPETGPGGFILCYLACDAVCAAEEKYGPN